jgi:hypothetical protein
MKYPLKNIIPKLDNQGISPFFVDQKLVLCYFGKATYSKDCVANWADWERMYFDPRRTEEQYAIE